MNASSPKGKAMRGTCALRIWLLLTVFIGTALLSIINYPFAIGIGSLFAQDQYARHAPVGRRLQHIDTVATRFLIPLNGDMHPQQATVGLATINTLIEEAFSHIGKRYRSGGKGPTAFDCSGFTSYVFKKLNYVIGHSSRDQYARNKPIKRNEMQRGDLVFFTSPRSGKNVGHVGIVVDVEDEGKTFTFIHASTNEGIKVNRSTDGFYARRYVGVRRVF